VFIKRKPPKMAFYFGWFGWVWEGDLVQNDLICLFSALATYLHSFYFY